MAWLISDRLYENWRCSQEQAAAFSAGSCLDGKPSAPSKSSHTQRAYLSPDKMTAFSRLSRFGMTYEPLTEDRGEELLTWFLAGFPARISVLPEKEKVSKASDPACGWKWRESLAKYDPDSRSWKTRQHSVLGGLEPYSETWPRWGSMRDGELCPLPTLVRRTSENEFGYWLPTPTACDHKGSGRERVERGENNNLRDWFKKRYGLVYPAALAVEYLMGWPVDHTDLKPLGTGKFRQWLQQHGDCLEANK